MESTPEKQFWWATVTTLEPSCFATLTRPDIMNMMELGERTVNVLQKAGHQRTKADIESVMSMFGQLPFLTRLRSRLLRRNCCQYMQVLRLEEKELLYKQGDVGDAMYIVVSGAMTVAKWRGSMNNRAPAARRGEFDHCGVGTTFGEKCE